MFPRPNEAPGAQEGQGDTLELLEYWRSMVKRKWAILGFALVVAMLAAAIALSITPIYRATAVVMFETQAKQVVSIEDVYGGATQSREYIQTQLEILRSREVARRTIVALQLWDHPEWDPRIEKTGLIEDAKKAVKQALGMTPPPVPAEWTPELLTDAMMQGFQESLQIELVRLSQIARVSFESQDPELAARVANELAKRYIENDMNARFEMTRQATNWLQERVEELRNKVSESERALQSYRERSGIISAQGVTLAGASNQIDGLTARLIEARLRRTDAESSYAQIRNAPPGSDMSSIPAVLRSVTVGEAVKNRAEAERRFSEVSQRFGPEHPRHIAAKAELDSAVANVSRQTDAVVSSLRREYETAAQVEREIERTLGTARASVQNLNRAEFELGVLQREVEANRDMYNLFMTRAKETSSTGDLQTPVARIVDPAAVPIEPAKPKKAQIVAVAFVLGLFVAMLAALLLDQLDRTLKTTEDVERKLRVPLLTTLPLLSRSDARRASSARLFTDQPNSVFAESIRTARTGVLLSALDAPNRILLVTSCLPKEGKSTVSINLALSHAQTQRTLLIDADMRRPSVAKALDLPPNIKGLSAFVVGSAPLAECVMPLDGTQLTVMPSGLLPPNPLELISSRRFKDSLAQLAEAFDVIIIDSPPVELVSDALMISPLASGVVFVTRAMETPTPLIQKCLERLRRADGHLLGVVLNQFDFKRASRYYGDYSGYGKYGYGKKGYGSAYGEAYGQPAAKGKPAAA